MAAMTTPSPQRAGVLVIDDDDDLRRGLVQHLRDADFDAQGVSTGAAGLAIAGKLRPVAVVLDVVLPDISGTEVCRQLRATATIGDVGILMLSARAEECDRVLGFEVGADDYVAKPFSLRELTLRVKALTRRATPTVVVREPVNPRKVWRGLELDAVHHRVRVDGVELELRPLEFKLATAFLDHPGRVFTRVELLQVVWGSSGEGGTRTVDTHVRRLRERLGAHGDAVETVHGFGYRLRDEAS
jgi:two-component system, OmpR family, phosphate regulon response regulator PhoB